MMKRRDSLASLFTGHGSNNLSGEDEELLADSEYGEGRLSPSKESDQPSLVVDSSSSCGNIVSDANSTNELKNNKLVNKRQGSRERLNSLISLSDLFSRVGRPPKIQARQTECATRQQKKQLSLPCTVQVS